MKPFPASGSDLDHVQQVPRKLASVAMDQDRNRKAAELESRKSGRWWPIE